VRRRSRDVAVVAGDSARALLARAMVFVNRKGATGRKLADANRILAAWREAEEIAAIADTLPGAAALNRLIDRMSR
jgi:hypothetical protein